MIIPILRSFLTLKRKKILVWKNLDFGQRRNSGRIERYPSLPTQESAFVGGDFIKSYTVGCKDMACHVRERGVARRDAHYRHQSLTLMPKQTTLGATMQRGHGRPCFYEPNSYSYPFLPALT
ncbi:hypothetical protein IAD21_03909 [Abditibacteriota bacterium]|nr:hypothetical protein IAD21_03909 [Abditibacteriota bacterium]